MPNINDYLGYGQSVFNGVAFQSVGPRKRVFATGNAVLGLSTTGFITVTASLQAPDDLLTTPTDGILIEALSYDVFASAGTTPFTVQANRCAWANSAGTLILPAGILVSTGLAPTGGATSGMSAFLQPCSPGGLFMADDLNFAGQQNGMNILGAVSANQPLQIKTIVTVTIGSAGGDTVNVTAFLWYRHVRGLLG